MAKFSPEVRSRPVRMILDHEGDYPSRWSTVVSVADNIGCAPQTLHEWVKKAEVDSIRQLSRAGRFETSDLVRTGDTVTAVCLAAAGTGVVLAPASLAWLRLNDVYYRPLADYAGSSSIACVWRDDAPKAATEVLSALWL